MNLLPVKYSLHYLPHFVLILKRLFMIILKLIYKVMKFTTDVAHLQSTETPKFEIGQVVAFLLLLLLFLLLQ